MSSSQSIVVGRNRGSTECRIYSGKAPFGMQDKAPVLPAEMEKHARASKLAYYSRCQLLKYQPTAFNQSYRAGKAKRKRGVAEDDSDEEPSSSAASTFLQIQ